MSEEAKQWEGEIVDGIFPLRKFLGGSDHSAVFLTEYANGEAQKAAIKLVTAERATADLQLTNWRRAAQLSHPNLLQLFRTGRCRIAGHDLLYLVMECAEENLGEVLPARALSAEETRDMLNPVLDALEYLHGKGFVHGDLKPANILASGDQLKLSSDAISRADEALGIPKKSSVYDPPEAVSGMKSSAGDVWALGTTLVEVLTQHVPEWQPGPNREPVVPATVPAPFAEIARQCLRLEPHKRVTVAAIAERLNSRVATASAAAAMAASSGIPIALATPPPVAPVAPKPAPKPAPAMTAPAVPRPAPRPPAAPIRPGTHTTTAYAAPKKRAGYLVPIIVGALVFVALLTVPRLFPRHSESENAPGSTSEPAASPATEPEAAKPVAAVEPAKSKADKKTASRETAANVAPAPAAEQVAAKTDASAAAKPEPLTPTSETEPATPPAAAPATLLATATPTSRKGAPKGEVLDQVLPDVSDKARTTIHGRVRVGVKVQVDAAGAVSDAQLDSAGPSQYFADQALKAAKRWAFTPPEVDGKSVASEWVLHFVFSPTDTKVTPQQTVP